MMILFYLNLNKVGRYYYYYWLLKKQSACTVEKRFTKRLIQKVSSLKIIERPVNGDKLFEKMELLSHIKQMNENA